VRLLILNADDLGADEARNAGIFEAIRAGSVTSASILVNGPALRGALEEIRSLGGEKISWGIHLNLSEGAPLSPGLRVLAGKDGCFPGKVRAHRMLMMRGDAELEEEVRREVEAQIQALRGAGIPVSHLDGHQHVHVFPAVVRAAVRAAGEHAIPWFRIPEEARPGPEARGIPESLAAEGENFSALARQARIALAGSGVRATDHFRGLYLKGRMNRTLVRELLKGLPPGLTEFMVHPGRKPAVPLSTPFSSFSTADRERELETLLSAEFRGALRECGIEPVPFPGAGP